MFRHGREIRYINSVFAKPIHTNKLQQILEVNVLLIRHILEPILAMDLRTSLVELAAHGVVHRVSGKPGRLTLVRLLLLHPSDEDDLSNDDTPENTPDAQDAFKRVDLIDTLLVLLSESVENQVDLRIVGQIWRRRYKE